MLGVFANTLTVLLGGSFGLLFARFISEKYTSAIMTALGLCTVYIGIDGALSGNNPLVLIASLVLGTMIGTLLDIDGKIAMLGAWVEKRFQNTAAKSGKSGSVAQGFITASLVFCVGSMTIVGSLNAGINGDNTMLFTKSMLDLVSSSMLAASLGVGVVCAAAFVLVFQGSLVALSGFIAPFLTAASQAEMICAGSVMIIGLGLNLIGITKIKVADMLPALVLAPLLTYPLGLLV